MFKSRSKHAFDNPAQSIGDSKSNPNLSLSFDRGNLSTTTENPNFEIIISSLSDPTAAQTGIKKDASTSSGSDDKRSLKEELRGYAMRGEWGKAESMFDENPELVRIPLTGNGNTALHVAVNSGKSEFVEGLLNSKHITPEDLEIPNKEGNTALCLAAISGNDQVIWKMVEKNKNLALIRGYEGMLPVHLAVFSGKQMAVVPLTSDDLLENMSQNNPKDIRRLFFMAITSYMFVVAGVIFMGFPEMLATARDEDDKLTALQILARQRPDQFDVGSDQFKTMLFLVEMVWEKVRELEYKTMLELISEPCPVLIDALISGNKSVVLEVIKTNPELVSQKDSQGRNSLHVASLYRQTYFLYYMFTANEGTVHLMTRAVDKHGNNALHFAAHHSLEAFSRSNNTILAEYEWFQQMERKFPSELRTMRNREGKTPEDVFYDKTKELSDKLQNTANGIANSGMVVAALIATVAFPAAMTAPGDKSDAWFYVFSLINAVALFASCASIISFLSIFTTAWFRPNKIIFPKLSAPSTLAFSYCLSPLSLWL